MVPSARLVVYYILSGEQRAELVADSVWFNVNAKCVNDLDVIFYYIISFSYFMKMIKGQRTTSYYIDTRQSYIELFDFPFPILGEPSSSI